MLSEIFEINCIKALVGFPEIPLDIYEPSTPPDFITPAISMWIQSPGGTNSCKKYIYIYILVYKICYR